MRRTTLTATLSIAALLVLGGCAAGGASTESSGDYAPSAPMPESVNDFADGEPVADEASGDRQVITTGHMTVTVEAPLEAATEAVRIAESVGGRVDGRTEYAPVGGDQGSATLKLRLPAADLSATLDKLKALGEVEEVSLSSNDVTMETQDLDARINALSASVDRLIDLLATADDTDVLIQLETAISSRQGELESLQSQRRYLADQVSLSTLTLNLISEADAPVHEPDTFLSGLITGWDAFVGFFAGLLVLFGVLLPWLVLLGLVAVIVIVIIRRYRRPAAADAVAPAETPAG